MNNCTIIIPSHNRPKLLLRSLKYYTKFKVELIVIYELEKIDQEIEYLFQKYSYKIQSKKLKNSTLINKLLTAGPLIKTDYCLISADDDFYEIESIIKGIKYLKKNKDFVSYLGKFIQFRKRKFHTNLYKMYNFEDKFIYDKKKFFSREFKFINSIYALYTTSAFIKIIIFQQQIQYMRQASLEFDFYFIALCMGKIKVSDEYWMFRDQLRYTNYDLINNSSLENEDVNQLFKIDSIFLNSSLYNRYINDLFLYLKTNNLIKINLKELNFNLNAYFQNINKSKRNKKNQNLKKIILKYCPKSILEIYYFLVYKLYLIKFSKLYLDIQKKENFKKVLELI